MSALRQRVLTREGGEEMSGGRIPVEVIQARGAKHLTKAEIEQRKATEVKAKPAKQLRCPGWLGGELHDDFLALSRKLCKLGIVADIDADTIARYVKASDQYLRVTRQLDGAIEARDAEGAAALARMQNTFFTQARQCAADLGMTVTGRAKLVIPEKEEDVPRNDPMLKLLAARQGKA